MGRRFFTLILLFSFFLLIAVPGPAAEDGASINLAIVDVGTANKVPASCMAQILVAFNKYEDIALLERSEIDRLLKEQALSLSMSNTDIVKAMINKKTIVEFRPESEITGIMRSIWERINL